MSEIKIARFVNMEACKSIFSGNSTFVLRSFEHYRYLIEKYGKAHGQAGKCDSNDGTCGLDGGGTAEASPHLISCWTRLDGDEPTEEEWDIFNKRKDSNEGNEGNESDDGNDSIVAIISTPTKILSFLKEAFKDNRVEQSRELRYPFDEVKEDKVNYADEVDGKNLKEQTVFTKYKKFGNQKEHRFALSFSSFVPPIDSYIFVTRNVDYMETCLANPKLSDDKRKELQTLCRKAACGYGAFHGMSLHEIIGNVDILFPAQR